ncbi:MAG: HAMP domain-containing sensor histidine kinase [Porticoccaceae bacterium]|nr:HAMP domain-containing sensor histidine kinase [Porticoccaceae bacterium]
MHELSIGVLLFLSSLLGVESLPETPPDWQVINSWEETAEGHFNFTAKNDRIVQECQRHPERHIQFPLTIHSSTQVIVNGKIIATTSSPDFQHTKSFYGVLVLSCLQLRDATTSLEWRLKSYTQYFAWFKNFPRVVEEYPQTNVYSETLNIVAAGILFSLSLLYALLFANKIAKQKLAFLICCNFFTAFYFIFNSPEFFGLSVSMLVAHKIADSGLWLGLMCFIHVLYLEELILDWMNIAYKVSVAVALTFILFASTGDAVQLGTTIPFPLTILLSGYAIYQLLKVGMLKSKKEFVQLIALAISFLGYWHDILVVTAMIDSFPMLSLGMPGSYIFILLSINESIDNTYAERDQLKELTEKLQQTNKELHHAQDELVKSEKMAVMGRAVARIAHELNTPIYSARSAMQNIQTQTNRFLDLAQNNKQQLMEKTRQYGNDLAVMSNVLYESLSRAAELVRNFKEISVDQINVRKKTFNLLEYIKTSLVTLEESMRRKNITVNLQGDNIMFYHDPSLFYQLINNLVSNTEKYAYSNLGGIIDIKLSESPNEIILIYADYGAGIPEKNLPRIFDAFFTTGGGSKGLGLGLNIVYSIVNQKLNGEITCISKENEGTRFTVQIPKGVEQL